MIYTNDESDRSLRQRNYILTVFVMPAIAGIIASGLVYAATNNKLIKNIDVRMGYILCINVIFILYSVNRIKWLKVPGEGWFYIKGIQNTAASMIEPAEYDEVFFESKKNKIIGIVLGAGLVATGIFVLVRQVSVLIPLFFILPAFFVAWQSIKQLRDKRPNLKLAKQGIWTRQLGFVNWKNVERTQVAVETKGRSKELCLNIYLKNTVFARAGQPDEKLWLTQLNNKDMVETVIDHLKAAS